MERDARWNAYPLVPTEFALFQQTLTRDLYLSPDADQHIKDQLRIILRLIEFSYYEYEFYDVASNLSHSFLEMALRIWYTKQTGKDNKKLRLEKLLEWASEENYFETDSKFYLDWLRKMRNFVTHRQGYWYQGAFMNPFIMQTLDLINDLYEDVNKRAERKDFRKAYEKVFSKIRETGILIQCDNETVHMAYHIQNGFINNKMQPVRTTFVFNTLFEVPAQFQPGESVIIHPFSTIELTDVTIENDDLIRGLDNNGKNFQITTLHDPKDIADFREWKNGFDTFNQSAWYDHSSDRYRAAYCSELRAQFHRQPNAQ